MNAASEEALLPGYQAELPLRWQPLDWPAEEARLEQLADSNLRLLNQLAQIEERSTPVDNPTPQDLELARLHAKMDLLMSALGEMATRFTDRPARSWLRLSWQNVSWRVSAGEKLAVGGVGLLELHLHPAIPQPLRWPARLMRSDAYWNHADLLFMSQALQGALERHVFLHYRRALAEARAAARR